MGYGLWVTTDGYPLVGAEAQRFSFCSYVLMVLGSAVLQFCGSAVLRFSVLRFCCPHRSNCSTASQSAGPRRSSQPLSAVRVPRMAQAVLVCGSAQARHPDAPLWPNACGMLSGSQCGCLAPRISGPSPHGACGQSIGAANPPGRPWV
jgi:hypothetical protein